MKTEKEQWKQIPEFPRYQISNYGRIKSFTSSLHPEGKILKPHKVREYLVVQLAAGTERGKNGYKMKQVHRLVAEAFIPIPDELSGYTIDKLQVDHIIPISNGGGIRNLETGEYNLRWVTPKQNTNNPLTLQNKAMATEKLKQKVYVYDTELQLVSAFTSTADAARIINKSQGNICSCCQGSLPTYLGRIWSYQLLDSMEQRKELEEKMKYQFQKNRQSTYRAIARYQKRAYAEGRSWYHRHREESKQQSREYYHSHREELLKKKRDDRKRIQETESKRVLPQEQGKD